MFTTYFGALSGFSRNARLYLIILGLATLIIDGVYGVVFNLYLLRLGYDPTFIGRLNSVGLITFAIASLPAGELGKRWGSRRSMIIGLLMVLVSSILLPFAGLILQQIQDLWLTLTYGFMFLGYSIFFVNGIPFLMGVTTGEQRSHAFSMQTAIFSLSAFAGGLLGGLLPAFISNILDASTDPVVAYRLPLWIASFCLIPGIWAAFSTTQARPVRTGRVRLRDFRLQRLDRGYVGLLTSVSIVRICQVSGMAVVFIFFNVYMDQAVQVPTAQIGLTAAVGRLLAVPVALSTALLALRWGNRTLVLLAGFGTFFALLPLALIPDLGAAAIGYIGVACFAAVRYPAFLAYSMEMVSEDQRPTMSGISEMTAGVSFALMAFLGGSVITSYGYAALFGIGALLTMVGTLLFWFYFRKPRGILATAAVVTTPVGASD